MPRPHLQKGDLSGQGGAREWIVFSEFPRWSPVQPGLVTVIFRINSRPLSMVSTALRDQTCFSSLILPPPFPLLLYRMHQACACLSFCLECPFFPPPGKCWVILWGLAEGCSLSPHPRKDSRLLLSVSHRKAHYYLPVSHVSERPCLH